MPGNEVGDRVHNFFGQENLYQGPHQLQAADGNWPMLTDNTWVGSPQHFGAPFISNFKNNSAHQSASSEGVGFENLTSDGFSHTQSNLWPDFNRSQAYNQQKTFNGFVQGHHMFQTRENEANFLRGRMVSDRKILTTRDITLQEAQSFDGPDLNEKNLMGLQTSDAHGSFDLFGGQQQMNGGHVNMMQSLRRQQSGMSDSQLTQQQAILSQIEGLQRQQQLQFESRHHGSVIMRQDSGNHSSAISGSVPVNDNLNYSWQHEHMAGNVNWPQFGASPVMHGSSSGLVLASEQNHALQMMGLVNQQIDQSPYGVHNTVRSISGPNSLTQMDKPAIQQLSGTYNSFPLNQYTAFPNQSDMQDENSIMRQNFQGKSLFEQTAAQGLKYRLNSENSNPVNSQQGNISMQESQGKRPLARQSETSPEKTEMQVTSSQYVATLDPTEEKILYGSDDSLWDVFGRTTTLGSGVSNTLDGVVFDSGFSSLQSGKWSALMQSAVAETLTGTSGVQEEWSGLSFRNAESPNENRHHVSVDAIKHLNSINHRDASRFKQTRPKSSFEKHNESSQTYTTQIPYCAEEESRCLDQSLLQKLPAEGVRVSENVNNSSGAEIKANNIVGSWTSQQSIPLNQHGKQNGGNFIGSVSPGKDSDLKYHENQNLPPNPPGVDYRRFIREDMCHSTLMFKDDPAYNSRVESLRAERAVELPQLPQIYNESKVVNGDAAVPQSSTFSSERESQQQYTHSGPHNIGKDVDSLGKRGHSSVDKYQHHLDNSSQILESFGNSGLNKGEYEILEMEESNRKENFKDSFNSSISNHTSAGGLGWSDVREGRRLTVGKQKSTSNVVRRSSTTRKFQYHPMGDLEVDAEPSNGARRFAHSQATSQEQIYVYKSHDAGSTGQSKFGHADKSSLEVGKGNGPTRGFGETPSNRMLTGFVPNKDASLDNFVGNDPSHNFPPSRQNMLELLHKVDHPREHGASANCSPSNFNPSSRMYGAENSDGPIDQTQPCQSSVSHGFGLQLGPPSQPPSMSDTAFSSHESFESDKILRFTTSEIKGKVNSWVAPTTSLKSLTPRVSLEGDLKNHIPCASESVHSGGHLQAKNKMKNWYSKQIDEFCDKVETSHSSFMPDVPEILPQPKIDASSVRNSAQQSDWLTTSQQGAFSKTSSNEWVSVTNPQQCSEPLKSSHMFKSFQSVNNLESDISKLKALNQGMEEPVSSPSGVHSVNLQSFIGREKPMKESHRKWVSSANGPFSSLSTLQGKETLGLPDPASANPSSNQRNYEALGHYLRPNNTSDQHISSLDQMRNINTEIDLTEKRFKSADSGLDASEIAARGGQCLSSGLNNIVQEASINPASLSPRDSKIQTLSSQPGDSPNASGLCQDGLVFCQSKSENLSNISCDKGGHSGISPQMAPAWFDRYGSFKNGNSTVKSLNQSLVHGKPSDSLSSLHGLKQPNTLIVKALPDSAAKSSPILVKELCRTGSDLLSSAVANESLVVRPQKRKTSTSELLPWHKELVLDCHRLQNISLADVEWAQAANRLIDKREDDLEMVDDGEVFFRAKKRHMSTTRLMQQLLRPPPAIFLSTAANLQYESGVYLVARSASGDACSAVSTAGTKTDSHLDSKNHISGKLKSSVETGDKLLHKLMEEFIGRAKKLENNILRVDKGVSILDLIVGCQDLEKFSVINRFAKFHSRGQVDGEEASSSDTTAKSQKICPQRYVTAVPMPRNLPDRVQCLSL